MHKHERAFRIQSLDLLPTEHFLPADGIVDEGASVKVARQIPVHRKMGRGMINTVMQKVEGKEDQGQGQGKGKSKTTETT